MHTDSHQTLAGAAAWEAQSPQHFQVREDGQAGLQRLRGSPWAPKLAGKIQAIVAEVLEPREYRQDRRVLDSSPKLLFLLHEFNAWTATASLLGTNLTQTTFGPFSPFSHTHSPLSHSIGVG